MKLRALLLVMMLTGQLCFTGWSMAGFDWRSDRDSGFWEASDNWTPEILDGGAPGAGPYSLCYVSITNPSWLPASVTVSSNPSLSGLVVGSGNALTVIATYSPGFVTGASLLLRDALFPKPEVINNGVINLYSWAVPGEASGFAGLTFDQFNTSQGKLTGSGRLMLNEGSQITGNFLHDTDHTIAGSGYIYFYPGSINKGQIVAEFGDLMVGGSFHNPGTLRASDSSSVLTLGDARITGGRIDPYNGVVKLNGARLQDLSIGGGRVEVTTPSNIGYASAELTGRVSLEEGTQLIFQDRGRLDLKWDGPVSPVLVNNGIIWMTGYACELYSVGAGYANEATLTGSGLLFLQGGHLKSYSGGTFTTEILISGWGSIEAPVTNKNYIMATDRTLEIQGNIDNHEGSIFGGVNTSGTPSLIISSKIFGGTIYPNGGLVKLGGATLDSTCWGVGTVEVSSATLLDNNEFGYGAIVRLQNNGGLNLNGDFTLTNNGIIQVNGGKLTNLDAKGAGATATLSGWGKVVLNGGYLGVQGKGGKFINDSHHTIEGVGVINVPIENHGNIVASEPNYFLYINEPITGSGTVSVKQGAGLWVWSTLEAGDFIMDKDAILQQGPYRISLSGDFIFAQQKAEQWESWGGRGFIFDLEMKAGSLLTGGSTIDQRQSLEIGGKDYGENTKGFTGETNNWGNFHLEYLTLSGDKTYLYLTDFIDNGHRGPAGEPEVLYVKHLIVEDGCTLNLNGYYLYADIPGYSPHLLNTWAGDWSWLGGGTVINEPLQAVPVPSTLLLFGPGLLGLGAAGWRRKRG